MCPSVHHISVQGLFNRGESAERLRGLALGVVPTGSGNGFAASIGAVDADTALWSLLKNERAPMDVVSIFQEPSPW